MTESADQTNYEDLPLWTVAGYWGDDDVRHVTTVIPGDVQVTGGDDVSEGGPFAVLVSAEDADAAEERVEGTYEADECEDPRENHCDDCGTPLDDGVRGKCDRCAAEVGA